MQRVRLAGGWFVDLIERRVHVRIRDVFFPDVNDLLLELHGNDVLEGKVIDLTESAEGGQQFAIVRLDRADVLSIIVAVDHLLP